MSRYDGAVLAFCAALLVACLFIYLYIDASRWRDCLARGGTELLSVRDNVCVDANGMVLR